MRKEEERKIKNVAASMAMEGMELNEEETDRMRRYLRGQITMEEAMAEIDGICFSGR